MNEAEMRQLYVDLQPGDFAEIVHHVQEELGHAPWPGSLKLVVIDAAGPSEPYLRAATIEAVLGAQESRAAHVTAAYRLTFDEEANAYRVEKEGDFEKERFDETYV